MVLAKQHIDLKMTMFDNVRELRQYIAYRLADCRKILKYPDSSSDLRRYAHSQIETYLHFANLLRTYKVK